MFFFNFLLDPDQNFDFRNLLKRTHIDEEEECDEEVEWGTLKRTFVPTTKARKIRRRHADGSNECLEYEEDDVCFSIHYYFYVDKPLRIDTSRFHSISPCRNIVQK